MKEAKILLPDSDLMPYEHLEISTEICNKLDEIWTMIDNSDMDETMKDIVKLPIKFNRKQKETMEIALLVYKNVLMGEHQSKIFQELKTVMENITT